MLSLMLMVILAILTKVGGYLFGYVYLGLVFLGIPIGILLVASLIWAFLKRSNTNKNKRLRSITLWILDEAKHLTFIFFIIYTALYIMIALGDFYDFPLIYA